MKKNSLDILKNQGAGFNTPEGYFASFEDRLMAKINGENMPKKTGFSAPDNYFDSLEERVFEKIDLAGFKAQQQFDIPKNYFDTIEDRVFEKIRKEEAAKPKVIRLRSRYVKVLAPIAIAASLLLIFIINYKKGGEESYDFESLTSTDVENWIDNDLITFESNTIAEVFNDVNLEDELNDDDLELLDFINGMDIESALLTD